MKMKRFLTVLMVVAVLFTFSFGSAFAALQYGTDPTVSTPVAEKSDFTGYSTASDATKVQGTFGISTIEQKSEVAGLEAKKADADGVYPADLQAKVDAAYDTAIAAVKVAKTNKEMNTAKEALNKALEKLDLADNSYEALKKAANFLENVTFPVDDGYYMIPDCGSIYVTEGKGVTAGNDVVFDWLMDQGYYGYVSPKAWEDVLTGKTVKNAVVSWLEEYYVGEYTFNQVFENAEVEGVVVKVSNLSKYGRKVYAEYLDLYEDMEAYFEKKTTTVDEFCKFVSEYDAFLEKYDVTFGDEVEDFVVFPNDETGKALNKLLVAIDKWYIDNYEDSIDAIKKINTAAGYTAAKADILATAKKIVADMDKYSEYGEDFEYLVIYMLDEGNGFITVLNALEKVITADAAALEKLDAAYTENVPVTGSNDKANFDSSEANLAAIAAARAAFDAYVADYTFAYEANEAYGDGESVQGVADIEKLVDYETKLLAAEYNKTAVPAKAEEINAEEAAKIQAFLNNATLKVTTTALGNNKIRVQAKVDAETYRDLVKYLGDDYTISYKFYHKTAAGKTYKAANEKNRNYITYTKISLKKGVKYKFRCALIVKNADGKVVATKSYKASTVGSRVCR